MPCRRDVGKLFLETETALSMIKRMKSSYVRHLNGEEKGVREGGRGV